MKARTDAERIAPLAVAVIIVLAVAAFGSPGGRIQLWLLTIGIAAGLPHGALDVFAAEAWLKPRLGERWSPAFICAYLSAGMLVITLWITAPALALAGFLVLASIHFGETLVPVGPLRLPRILAHGLAPIVVPSFAHTGAVVSAFAPLAGSVNAAMIAGALAGPVALVWLATVVVAGWRGPVFDLAANVLVFVALPPLAAFAVYFAGLHGPRALAENRARAQTPRAGPPRDRRAVCRLGGRPGRAWLHAYRRNTCSIARACPRAVRRPCRARGAAPRPRQDCPARFRHRPTPD